MNQPLPPVGIHEGMLEKSGGRFAMGIPSGIPENTSVPLLLALHYGGAVTPYYGKGFLSSLVYPAFEGYKIVTVAPDCRHGDWVNQKSEKEVLELLEALLKRYPIDEKKIAICGYSIGGMGTWYLASRHQDLFCAAIPIASPPLAEMLETEWRIPVYVIHSRGDEWFPYQSTQDAIAKLQRKFPQIEFHPVTGITHFNVPGFIPALKEAAGWLETQWTSQEDDSSRLA